MFIRAWTDLMLRYRSMITRSWNWVTKSMLTILKECCWLLIQTKMSTLSLNLPSKSKSIKETGSLTTSWLKFLMVSNLFFFSLPSLLWFLFVVCAASTWETGTSQISCRRRKINKLITKTSISNLLPRDNWLMKSMMQMISKRNVTIKMLSSILTKTTTAKSLKFKCYRINPDT